MLSVLVVQGCFGRAEDEARAHGAIALAKARNTSPVNLGPPRLGPRARPTRSESGKAREAGAGAEAHALRFDNHDFLPIPDAESLLVVVCAELCVCLKLVATVTVCVLSQSAGSQ